MHHQVTRFDAARIGGTRRTPQGFLRARARLTRIGVLEYRRADGTVSRELRRPEAVFAPASLATLGDAPLTDLHPKVMVSPDNARELSVGHVSQSSVRADGRFVEADIVVTDARMIAAIESRKRGEVSCGYTCKLVQGAGVWNGERYDAEQVDIVYNHAGLGPANWGRSGSEVSVRLDGLDGTNPDDFATLEADDAVRVDADDAPDDDDAKGQNMADVVIKVDGIDCSVPTVSAQVLTKALEARDTQLTKVRTDATAAQARIDTLQGELDAAKVKLTEATDPARFDAAVTQRIALVERARTLLPADTKLDGLPDRAIKELCVKARDAKADFAGKSLDYVQARFDALDDAPPKSTDLSKARKDTALNRVDGGGNAPPKYETPAWRQPLAVTRGK